VVRPFVRMSVTSLHSAKKVGRSEMSLGSWTSVGDVVSRVLPSKACPTKHMESTRRTQENTQQMQHAQLVQRLKRKDKSDRAVRCISCVCCFSYVEYLGATISVWVQRPTDFFLHIVYPCFHRALKRRRFALC